MLKLRDDQMTMWDTILPEAIRKLPADLAVINELLDDVRFLQPFVELHPEGKKSGRPTFAIEKYMRLMVLKHKYGLGYESLVKEVGDSITWPCSAESPLTNRCRTRPRSSTPANVTATKSLKTSTPHW